MNNLDYRMNEAMKDFDKLELELYKVYFASSFGLIQYTIDVMTEHFGEDFSDNTSSMNSYILHFLITKWAIGDEIERIPVVMGRLKQFHTNLIESEFVYRLNPMVQFVRELVIFCKEGIE